MTTWNRAGALAAGIAIATALAACGANTDVSTASTDAPVDASTPITGSGATRPAADAPSDNASAAPAPVGAATGDVFVVDHVSMADQPCHVMGNTVMGRCTEADIDKVIGETDYLNIDVEQMKDSPCHVMDGTIMGQCAQTDIARLRIEQAIVVDTALMAEQDCHEMDGVIMGQCTEEDVKRLADEIRTARPATSAQP